MELVLGFGDKFWEKIIFNKLVDLCEAEGVEVKIDESILRDGNAGIFTYHSKININKVNELIKERNDLAKSLINLGESEEENPMMEEYKNVVKITLADKKDFWVLLYEIGQYLLFKDDAEQTEKSAIHYRMRLIKQLPEWLAFRFYESAQVYANVSKKTAIKYLGINPNKELIYRFQNWKYKRLYKKGEFELCLNL